MNADASSAPIGVFDSGLGGLTVVRALRERLPHESLLYVGDTARVPYGPKSPETVRRYALQIADWLQAQGVKQIVVACNTATAHALDALRAHCQVPVIGVVAPGARAAVHATATGAIGVIGTAGTIASRAYDRAIHELAPDVSVQGIACPLLVPLVEEGWLQHPATTMIATEYLAPFGQPTTEPPIDVLVLGCTHYPLIAHVIRDALPSHVRLVDSAAETARETEATLHSLHMLNASTAPGALRVVASDAPERFLLLGRRFLGDALRDVEHVPFA